MTSDMKYPIDLLAFLKSSFPISSHATEPLSEGGFEL
jgi:hypothetical protein